LEFILYSPMIGITEMARFSGVAGWPAVFPTFARAAWLGIMPEFNPFKYNSFPVNGGRQSSLMTRTLQPRLAQLAREERISGMPPVLTFQSVMDFTTSARAVVKALHENLPDNGRELVLFDLNRNASCGLLMRANTENILSTLLPPPPRHYAVSLVTNRSNTTREVALLRVAAGSEQETRRDLDRLAGAHVMQSLSWSGDGENRSGDSVAGMNVASLASRSAFILNAAC